MVDVSVLIYPVSFVLEDGPPRFVTLSQRDGTTPSTSARGDLDATARALLVDVLQDVGEDLHSEERYRVDLVAMCSRFIALAGTHRDGDSVHLIYTAAVPVPLAEKGLDVISESTHDWRTINQSRQRGHTRATPEQRHGPDAIVLDFWRQLFEETDMALDFLPEYLSLHQLRSLYDAIWGYAQDPSGYKRWAIDRTGSMREFLDDVHDPSEVEAAFFAALGGQLSGDQAARAGALIRGDLAQVSAAGLGLPVALAAATSANRLVRRRGPEPTWFRKSDAWLPGPTWIENVYPPRPAWTRWDTRRGHRD